MVGEVGLHSQGLSLHIHGVFFVYREDLIMKKFLTKGSTQKSVTILSTLGLIVVVNFFLFSNCGSLELGKEYGSLSSLGAKNNFKTLVLGFSQGREAEVDIHSWVRDTLLRNVNFEYKMILTDDVLIESILEVKNSEKNGQLVPFDKMELVLKKLGLTEVSFKLQQGERILDPVYTFLVLVVEAETISFPLSQKEVHVEGPKYVLEDSVALYVLKGSGPGTAETDSTSRDTDETHIGIRWEGNTAGAFHESCCSSDSPQNGEFCRPVESDFCLDLPTLEEIGIDPVFVEGDTKKGLYAFDLSTVSKKPHHIFVSVMADDNDPLSAPEEESFFVVLQPSSTQEQEFEVFVKEQISDLFNVAQPEKPCHSIQRNREDHSRHDLIWSCPAGYHRNIGCPLPQNIAINSLPPYFAAPILFYEIEHCSPDSKRNENPDCTVDADEAWNILFKEEQGEFSQENGPPQLIKRQVLLQDTQYRIKAFSLAGWSEPLLLNISTQDGECGKLGGN